MATGYSLDELNKLPDPPKGAKGYSFEEIQGLEEPTSQKDNRSLLKKTGDVVNTFFPGKEVGEAIGTLGGLGYTAIKEKLGKVPKGTTKLYDTKGPTPFQTIGDVAQGGLFLGGGPASQAATKGAGLVARGTNLVKNVARGAAAGYGVDVTQNLKEGATLDKDILKPGAGTVTGGALPVAGAVVKGGTKLLGRGLSESSGALTGQGYGGQKALIEAIEAGGNRAKIAKQAMRGGIDPDRLKEEADAALGSMYTKRANQYQQSLSKLEGNDKSYDISPVINKMKSGLDSFKVKISPEGQLDFSQSPIRFNKKAQQDIATIFDEMKDFGTRPGDRTVVGLDSLKRAFGDLYTESGEARKFVSEMQREVRKVLKQVPGYDQMSEKYAQSTELINSVRKDLSVGDAKSADTAYRKLLTIVRSDTDARMQLLKELDDASGGKLIPMVAGELSKTWLPRGLSRYFSGGGALAAGAFGGGLSTILQTLIIGGMSTSPRLAGEIINVLGVSKKHLKPVSKALNSMLLQFPAIKGIKEGMEDNQ